MKRIALLIFFTLCLSGCSTPSDDEILIGVVAPFSGQEGVAQYGQNIRNASELAVGKINASGGVLGKKLRLRYEDSQLIPSTAIKAVQKLIDFDDVKIIVGPVGSSSTIASVPIAESREVLLVSPASTSNELSGMSRFVFRTIAPDSYEANTMADFVLKNEDLLTFAVIYVDNAGTRGPAEIFRKRIQASGKTVSAFEVVPQGSTDVRNQVNRALSASPDALYVTGYALELGSLIRQIRQRDSEIPIYSFQVMEEPKVIEIAQDSAEGVIFTSPSSHGKTLSPQAEDFENRYSEEYGVSPGIFAANAYDAIFLIKHVVEQVGSSTDTLQLADALRTVRAFPGVSGEFDITEEGDSTQPSNMFVIEDGAPKPI